MKDKRTLLRVTRNQDGSMKLDFTGKASGRGAYICDNPDCVAKAVKQRLFNKVFGCEVSQDIYDYIRDEYIRNRQQ